MFTLVILGILAGLITGYRVGTWHALKRLGAAELRNRLDHVRSFKKSINNK